ncbi:uncharacterized protein LOC109858934 [Pseudomyrmex gracilis]|uniref:uncharacterized protein LOC109858934 n=1 Tax=Pseudomyrmex gracilis TaxID=219809 RepID=UPI0009959CE6|nr:uncharacterized protein LOC109858934 [Pseudomyrmex gracilis]
MEKIDNMDVDSLDESTVPAPFVFSKPNAIENPPRIINFGLGSDHCFDISSSKKNMFTFAAPTVVSQYSSDCTSSLNNKSKYKPVISRTKTYEPTVNVFANALKDTGAFEQLKKNSRSQVAKVNINNAITCSGVPKELLTKSMAKEYFMKYGNIVKLTVRPKKCIIVVVYAKKEEANNAYYSAGEYKGDKFHISWTKMESLLKAPSKKKDKNIVTNLLKASNDEIKYELEAMAQLEYNLHPVKGAELVSDANTLLPLKIRTPGGKTTSKLDKAAAKDKPDAEIQKAKSLPTTQTSMEELQNIIHQVAVTAEDKYKVLEARDRLMRLKRVKPASLATAKVTTGTCPDMCPEKERLMRESQRQVASYEQLEANEYKINHVTAIKQYSRSSADQEEPMPHELRPVKSLKMTMSYLLHEIVDLCEDESANLAEWYHFLWDRTRGIRKDITQQELCCVDSVELIEQCARFHIVCSERLCAEDSSVFDKKINSENLTKCLQTLKYMYNDLRVKGITCENEAEFRAYVVLLNLNNGNFLYDLQQLPRSVQNSPEVQFAIKVYFALDSNNYYKFFQLVRETTYLNACILLRYFNQIRLKAFRVIIKAYCRSTQTAFPLYELIDILGFENEREAKYFCAQVRQSLSDDDLHVYLNRQNFVMPAVNIPQIRAFNLIESKRISLKFTVGQCIAGKKMPEKTYLNHKPHNSFDANGNLKPESVNAADQNSNINFEVQDSYEFGEKETKKTTPRSMTGDSKNQNAAKNGSSPARIKKQTLTNASVESTGVSHKLASVSESVSVSDIFKTSVSDAYERSRDKFEEKSQSSAQVKSIFDQKSDDRAKARENTVAVFSKQPETSRGAESVASFQLATSKSIFSGAGSGNIFSRHVVPPPPPPPFPSSSSSAFGGNVRFPAPVSKVGHYPTLPVSNQQSSSNNTNTSSKMTKEQRTVFSKEQQKDVTSKTNKHKESIRSKELEKLEQAKRMQQIEEKTREIYNSLHAEVVREFCSAIAKESIDKIEMYDTLSRKILSDMIDEVTFEMCDVELSGEIKHQQLQAIALRILNKKIGKCFNAWKRYVSRKKRQRKALEDTPVYLQKQSVEECARMLYSKEQELVIRNMRRKRIKIENDATTTIGDEKLAPIEIIVYAGIKENLRLLDINFLPKIFWKLAISWPDLANRPILWHYKKTMNQYLYPDDFTMDPILKVHRPNCYETLFICLRHFEGFISERHLIGADALFFIADASENYQFVAKRLMRTVLSRHKLVSMPLAFIVLGNGDLKDHNENIVSDLESLLESGYVSEYTIMYEKNLSKKVILNLTQSTILWLAVNKSPPNPLEMDYLYNVYDICLSKELWLRILGDSMFNKQLSKALTDPNFVIDLHNEAVNHLIDIISDPESMLYTNFAPELKRFLKLTDNIMPCGFEYFDESWKRDEYRANLEIVMNKFILPSWNAPWPLTDMQDLQRHVVNYLRKILPDSNCITIFSDILSNIFLTSGSLQISNFIHIILHIVKEKVRLLDENQVVIYNRNHLKHFRTLPWWFKSNVLTEFMSRLLNLDNSDTMSNEPLRKRSRLNRTEDDLNNSALDEEFNSLAEFCHDTSALVMEVHSASEEIENRLQAQQLENTMLEDRLKKALADDANLIEKNV